MLVKDKTFTIHHQNIQSLAIEMHKTVNNLPGGNLTEFFVRNNHNYNLHVRSELPVPGIILSIKVKILLAILDQ